MLISSVLSHLATLHMQWIEIIDMNFNKTVNKQNSKGNVKYTYTFFMSAYWNFDNGTEHINVNTNNSLLDNKI